MARADRHAIGQRQRSVRRRGSRNGHERCRLEPSRWSSDQTLAKALFCQNCERAFLFGLLPSRLLIFTEVRRFLYMALLAKELLGHYPKVLGGLWQFVDLLTAYRDAIVAQQYVDEMNPWRLMGRTFRRQLTCRVLKDGDNRPGSSSLSFDLSSDQRRLDRLSPSFLSLSQLPLKYP